jgi:hypothetical protein
MFVQTEGDCCLFLLRRGKTAYVTEFMVRLWDACRVIHALNLFRKRTLVDLDTQLSDFKFTIVSCNIHLKTRALDMCIYKHIEVSS